MIHSIIFDIDGTLLDTARMNLVPLQKIIEEELSLEVDYESLLHFTAYDGHTTLEMLNIDKSVYPRWVSYVNQSSIKAIPYEGIRSLLEQLNTHEIQMGIVSSKKRDQFEIDMVTSGLDRYFNTIVLSEDTDAKKPHPDPIFHAMKSMGINDPESTLYIGDTMNDLIAAHSAGIKFGLALWGTHDFTFKDQCDYVFTCPKEIIEVINHEESI